jgi:endonuclease/exonuclease/phosphatase family metal-dependent hydrolase
MIFKWIGCFAVGLTLLAGGCAGTDQVQRREVSFSAPAAGVVEVMSFNVRYGSADDGYNHWTARNEVLFDVIAGHAVDVIGLQEAMDFQVNEISQALPQYAVYSAGRDDGKKGGESCAILYRKDRFKFADSGTFWFSNTPWEVGSKHWGNDYPRICSWVRLIDKTGGKGFYVYNVHLDHVSQPSREKSARLLAKRISLRPVKDPVIVMGDFNMDMGNPGMMYLQKVGYDTPYERLISTWVSVHPHDEPVGTSHGFNGGSGRAMIDHILVEESTAVLKADVDQRALEGRYPSDHYPVTAQVKLY